MSHVGGSANFSLATQTDDVALAMNIPNPASSNEGQPEQVALDDLLEVEACLREMLKNTSDPAALQRLFNLHREIQRYISEVNTKK